MYFLYIFLEKSGCIHVETFFIDFFFMGKVFGVSNDNSL